MAPVSECLPVISASLDASLRLHRHHMEPHLRFLVCRVGRFRVLPPGESCLNVERRPWRNTHLFFCSSLWLHWDVAAGLFLHLSPRVHGSRFSLGCNVVPLLLLQLYCYLTSCPEKAADVVGLPALGAPLTPSL